MKIGIIGTGNIGGALARSLVAAGHSVTLAGRDQAKLATVAAATGAAAGSVADAAAGADVTVLAVYWPSASELATQVAAANPGTVIVDVTNPATPDFSAPAFPGGPSAAEQLQALVPGTAVVKAFNTLFAANLADTAAHGVELDGLYAADDTAAGATVAALIASLGLRPVKVGGLVRARELEAMAWLNITLNMTTGGDWRSAFRLVGAPAAAVSAPEPAAA
jgi:predicted dinucleotide-binding enzyme